MPPKMTLERLQKMAEVARVGGVRRRHKAVRKVDVGEDLKLNTSLKKLGVSPIPDIEEVNMLMHDGNVLNFVKPQIQASPSSNIYVVSGAHTTKTINDLLPAMLSQLSGAGLDKIAPQELEKLKAELEAAKTSEAEAEATA